MKQNVKKSRISLPDRIAAALRENLRKRKQQAQLRQQQGQTPGDCATKVDMSKDGKECL